MKSRPIAEKNAKLRVEAQLEGFADLYLLISA